MSAQGSRPSPQFDWFIPIDGDGEHIGTRRAERPPTFDYLRRVTEAAEAEGYHALLIPTRFANGLFEAAAPLAETWTTATALAAVSQRIRLLIAVRPGFIATGLFAQMAAALDQISGGRIDINVVPGGIPGDIERLGGHTAQAGHSERYQQAEEFIEACRRLWARPEPVDYEGQSVQLRQALVSPGPVGAGPRWYLGGASDAALGLAARQADRLLIWIQPLDAIDDLMRRAREAFAQAGRPASFGLRAHLIVRETEAAAWAAADALLSRADPAVVRQRAASLAGTPMVGARAQGRTYAEHRLGPHLWNGIATVRVNCGTAIVGSPEQVAHELLGYWRLGVDEFILSGYPHLEESQRVARDVLPQLRDMIAGAGG